MGSNTPGHSWINSSPIRTVQPLRVINPEAAFKVVIEAHADEISWFCRYYFSRRPDLPETERGHAGSPVAPSMRVLIHAKKGW